MRKRIDSLVCRVDVAERPGHGVHRVPEGNLVVERSQVKEVVKLDHRAGRAVLHGAGAKDGLGFSQPFWSSLKKRKTYLTVLPVQVLPEPVDTVELRVVEVEHRVAYQETRQLKKQRPSPSNLASPNLPGLM